jgi:hypothetical protein
LLKFFREQDHFIALKSLYRFASATISGGQLRTNVIWLCRQYFLMLLLTKNQFWSAQIKKCMNQKKIGHIGFKKKNAFRSVKKSRKKVER